MGTKRDHLNKLLIHWPRDTVAVQQWFTKRGISRQLAAKYVHSGWIKRIGRGGYIRAGDAAALTGAVYALQTQLGYEAHVGGKTALELQGYGHFLPMKNIPEFYLFGRPGRRLPSWFAGAKWESSVRYRMSRLFSGRPEAGLEEISAGGYSIKVSSPERAALELAELVPAEQSFEGAGLLMEGLTTLRPALVQALLMACRSIKAKRLFLFLAEKCGHAWVDKLDISKIRLGSGKRLIVRGGRLDPKYQITVPADISREVP
jgi:hypothetical protein